MIARPIAKTCLPLPSTLAGPEASHRGAGLERAQRSRSPAPGSCQDPSGTDEQDPGSSGRGNVKRHSAEELAGVGDEPSRTDQRGERKARAAGQQQQQ